MSNLKTVFESLVNFLHHGPSMRVFHEAVIEEHDALEVRVKALEENSAIDAEMRSAFQKAKAYHEASIDVGLQVNELVEKTQASQDEEPVAEQAPADPAQTPVSDLLTAPPGPDSAGLNEAPETAPEPVTMPNEGVSVGTDIVSESPVIDTPVV